MDPPRRTANAGIYLGIVMAPTCFMVGELVLGGAPTSSKQQTRDNTSSDTMAASDGDADHSDSASDTGSGESSDFSLLSEASSFKPDRPFLSASHLEQIRRGPLPAGSTQPNWSDAESGSLLSFPETSEEESPLRSPSPSTSFEAVEYSSDERYSDDEHHEDYYPGRQEGLNDAEAMEGENSDYSAGFSDGATHSSMPDLVLPSLPQNGGGKLALYDSCVKGMSREDLDTAKIPLERPVADRAALLDARRNSNICNTNESKQHGTYEPWDSRTDVQHCLPYYNSSKHAGKSAFRPNDGTVGWPTEPTSLSFQQPKTKNKYPSPTIKAPSGPPRGVTQPVSTVQSSQAVGSRQGSHKNKYYMDVPIELGDHSCSSFPPRLPSEEAAEKSEEVYRVLRAIKDGGLHFSEGAQKQLDKLEADKKIQQQWEDERGKEDKYIVHPLDSPNFASPASGNNESNWNVDEQEGMNIAAYTQEGPDERWARWAKEYGKPSIYKAPSMDMLVPETRDKENQEPAGFQRRMPYQNTEYGSSSVSLGTSSRKVQPVNTADEHPGKPDKADESRTYLSRIGEYLKSQGAPRQIGAPSSEDSKTPAVWIRNTPRPGRFPKMLRKSMFAFYEAEATHSMSTGSYQDAKGFAEEALKTLDDTERCGEICPTPRTLRLTESDDEYDSDDYETDYCDDDELPNRWIDIEKEASNARLKMLYIRHESYVRQQQHGLALGVMEEITTLLDSKPECFNSRQSAEADLRIAESSLNLLTDQKTNRERVASLYRDAESYTIRALSALGERYGGYYPIPYYDASCEEQPGDRQEWDGYASDFSRCLHIMIRTQTAYANISGDKTATMRKEYYTWMKTDFLKRMEESRKTCSDQPEDVEVLESQAAATGSVKYSHFYRDGQAYFGGADMLQSNPYGVTALQAVYFFFIPAALVVGIGLGLDKIFY